MTPDHAISALWIAWIVSWVVAAKWSRPTAARPGAIKEFPYRALMTVGVVLLFGFFTRDFDRLHRLWTEPTGLAGWMLVAPVAMGFLFCWWARVHLGRLWSSGVTRKADHRIIDSGPYALVRHPIYSGLLLSLIVTAAAHGTLLSGLGGALMATSMVLKARLEERFLRRELGEDSYDAYARRVPMLVPFWPQ